MKDTWILSNIMTDKLIDAIFYQSGKQGRTSRLFILNIRAYNILKIIAQR
jgi:hypothetical protein